MKYILTVTSHGKKPVKKLASIPVKSRVSEFDIIFDNFRKELEKFYQMLNERRVTTCGYGVMGSAMIVCKNLGAIKGKLLSYATSGDVSVDTESVVGYDVIKFV